MNSNTVIAYPIDTNLNNCDNLMEDSVYGSSLGDSKFAEDTIEMGTNFFSQLDSMIAAVKVESSALDTMKEKLKEVENLRNQISNFTKRLLDADQTNLNLKSNLVKAQEMYADIKKSKAEIESTIVPIRQELNRVKDQCNKERTGRLAAQQQLTQLKDQFAQLENMNEMLDREVKTIPALNESNEILKNDLTSLRKRYKDEKNAMQKHIKLLESQSKDVEVIRGCVRELSLKLLDVCNSNNVSSINTSTIAQPSSLSIQNNNMRLQQQQQLQQTQNRYPSSHQPSYQQQQQQSQQAMNNIYYETTTETNHHVDIDNEDEYEDDDYDNEDDGNDYISGGAYLEEGSQISGLGGDISITSKHSIHSIEQQQQIAILSSVQKNNSSTTGKKKKKNTTNVIRRVMNNNNTVGSITSSQNTKNNTTNQPSNNNRMMQQQQSASVIGGTTDHINNYNNYNNNIQQQQQQQHSSNMSHSFSLPRI